MVNTCYNVVGYINTEKNTYKPKKYIYVLTQTTQAEQIK